MGLPGKWEMCSRTILLEDYPRAIAHWGDTVAVGLGSNVVLLDAITGIRTSIFSGHIGAISSLEFSQGGTLLVSRSYGQPVNLWDVQTGGVIRTFSDNTSAGSAISISPDGNTIALGAYGGKIHLWDVRTGKCHAIETGQGHIVKFIRFSPVNSRRLVSSSIEGTIQQWDVDGHQIGTSYQEEPLQDLAYSSDGTRLASCGPMATTVRDSESGAVVVRIGAPGPAALARCCFSPDGRFVACAAGATIYIWDITISGNTPVARLVGHSSEILFIAFPSSIISASDDQSMKLWQSSSFFVDPKTTDHTPAPHGSAPIWSTNLFAKDNTVVTSDAFGMVRTWDLTTGRCNSSLSTPAIGKCDTHLAGGVLMLVWWAGEEKQYHVWDVGKGQLFQRFRSSHDYVEDIKISGDGSKVFGLHGNWIEAVSMQTGGIVGRVRIPVVRMDRYKLFVRGSKVGVANPCRRGWDFGGLEVSGFGEFPDQPRLDLVNWSTERDGAMPSTERVTRWIGDTVTGGLVFRIPERYIKPDMEVIWGGRYLLIWSPSGEIVVMDFGCIV